MNSAICYLRVNQGTWCQEHYDTASGHARVRASELRQAGFDVTISPLGMQVTRVGLVKMTMVDVRPGRHADTTEMPAVIVERL